MRKIAVREGGIELGVISDRHVERVLLWYTRKSSTVSYCCETVVGGGPYESFHSLECTWCSKVLIQEA